MMERRAKERLIGASILVALIVIVVPEFLAGPKHIALAPPLSPPGQSVAVSEVRNVTVDLATSKATAAVETPAADLLAAPASALAPNEASPTVSSLAPAASSQPVHRTPIDTHPPAALPPLESAATPPKVSVSNDAVHHGWSVQLGVFASKANAENLAHQLKSQGAAVYVVPAGRKTAPRFKVRVGPLADRAAAERAVAKLKVQGYGGSVVPP